MLTVLRGWSTSSRRLAALFLVVLVPSAATLVWLGVQLLEQDRRLWADRDLERREAAADIVVRTLGQKLAAAEAALAGGDAPDGAVIATLSTTRVTVHPSDRVLWVPAAPHRTEANTEAFADAEIAEFRRTGDHGLAVYTALRRASDRAVQAGALLRLARVHRASVAIDAAIEYYRELTTFTEIAFDGMPADLLARRAICELLEQSGEPASLAREVEALRTDFLASRWMLDRSGWTLAAEEIEKWTGRPLEVSSEQRALTAALDWLRQQHLRPNDGDNGTIAPAGRSAFRIDHVSILVHWRTVGDTLTALFVPPALANRWAREAMPAELADPDALVLTDEAGTIVAGTRVDSGSRLVARLGTETGLPWNVALKPTIGPADTAAFASRRRLLGAGLGAIAILLSGGSYLLWRTVRRELAVARIQTEFVAAVSHEFRTPLTSLQHVTELLEEDDDLPRERKQALYRALGRSTERLRGLVESLLDFARMEDGRRPYDLQPADPSLLVKNVVAEFERHAPPAQTVITLDLAPPGTLRCRADAAALGHALWNLLDNAVKYSPKPHLVRVSIGRRGKDISIAVADQGFGIPARERESVFRKFVRGSDSVRRGIEGTGLGLAMVSHIVAAHDGRIELDSQEGRGSTFTILLPTFDQRMPASGGGSS